MFICEECKDLENSTSESMDSEDRYRAEYDMDAETEEALLRDDSSESTDTSMLPRNDAMESRDITSNSIDKGTRVVLKSTSDMTNTDVDVLKSTSVLSNQNATVLKSTVMLPEVQPGKQGNFHTDEENANQNSVHKTPVAKPRGKGPMSTESDDRIGQHVNKEHDWYDSGSQYQYDQNHTEELNTQAMDYKDNFDQGRGSEDINSRDKQIGFKMDQILDMVQGVRQDINQLNVKVNDQELKTEQYIKTTQTQINNMQKSIADSFYRQNEQRTMEIKKTVEDTVAREMDESIGLRLDSIFTVRMAPTVDTAVNIRLNRLEKQLDEKIDNRVENLVNQKMQNEFDEFQDQLWRQKNILIVGLTESNSPDVEQRKMDDLRETVRIFNLFVDIEKGDIEGIPVRLGRIGAKPRTLRVTMRSEFLVKQIIEKARNQNHLLNPTETDNRKKLYLNRDYTPKIIELRKNLYEEKKERERKGETNLVYRKRKVVQDPRASKYPNQSQYGRKNEEPNRSRDRNRNSDYRPRDNSHHNIPQELRYINQNQLDKGRLNYSNQGPYRQALDRQYDQPRQDINRSGNQGHNSKQDDSLEMHRSPLNRKIQTQTQDSQYELSTRNSANGHRNDWQHDHSKSDQNRYSNQGQYAQTRPNPSTLYRDEEGPYYRDEHGREIRGAEASYNPERQYQTGNGYYKNGGFNDYPDKANQRGHRVENEERDYDDRERQQSRYRSGREMRESSKNFNKNKPGSKPYAGAQGY